MMSSTEEKKTNVDESKSNKIQQKMCKPMDIHNMLLFPGRKIIIDIRPKKEYLTKHMALSTNIPINSDEEEVISVIYETLKSFWWAAGSVMDIYCYSNKETMKNGADMIWYKYIEDILYKYFSISNGDDNDDQDDDIQFMFKSMYILSVDYERFEGKYNHLCTNKTDQSLQVPPFPSIIIDNKLFLSGSEAAESKNILINFGVTHILNMTTEIENCFENDKEELSHLTYLRCKIKDFSFNDISSLFNKCITFIDDALNENNGDNNNCVLVHCFAGISRSPSIIIAYLIKIKKMTFEQALQFTKQKRSIISPNQGFIQQLQDWGATHTV